MLLHDARRDARVDRDGTLVLLDEQDRSRWDVSRIAEGRALVERAMHAGRPGPYQLQAAIAALHDEALTADATDWPQIAALYQAHARLDPSPVVELNRSVAVAMVDGPPTGLVLVDALAADGRLQDYPYLHAARADLLRRLERWSKAAAAYREALARTTNAAERRFLERRLTEVGRAGRRPD